MKPAVLYLCAKCQYEMSEVLKLTRIGSSGPPGKKPCANCRKSCYGDLFKVQDKDKST